MKVIHAIKNASVVKSNVELAKKRYRSFHHRVDVVRRVHIGGVKRCNTTSLVNIAHYLLAKITSATYNKYLSAGIGQCICSCFAYSRGCASDEGRFTRKALACHVFISLQRLRYLNARWVA